MSERDGVTGGRNKGRSLDLRVKVAIATLLLIAGLLGCATVPMTGRSSLSLVSDGEMASLGSQQYGEVLKKAKLSTNAAQVEMVRRVGARIAKASD
jgi:predicted Zn-dependent protease